jgi:hypothetical protein
MTAMNRNQTVRRSWGRNRFGYVIAALLVAGGLAGERTASAAQAGPPPKEGRIVNLDSKPFTFRLARSQGAVWSSPMTVGPGEALILKAGGSGEVNALEGITADGHGHVTIDFPELGGRLRLQLPALDRTQNRYVPFWFHVKDSNGFSRMIQAPTKEAAQERQKQLQAEPPYGAAELEAIKRTLRANFMLYDE